MTNRRAVVLERFKSDLVTREFSSVPPEPGAAVAAVTYGGICGTDVHLQQGSMTIPLPLVLGHEAVGTITSLGEGVTTDAVGQPLREGDAVTWMSNISCGSCFYCAREHEPSLCTARKIYGINQSSQVWPHLSGGWAEEIYLQPGSTIVRLPEGISAEQAISLGCAGPTIVHGLLRVATPRLGETVVVQGSGPVGLAAAMYAKLAGAAKVILVGGPANRLKLAAELGVSDVNIDIFEMSDAAERADAVLAETMGGRGADLVVEATGVPTAVAEGIELCRKNGRYLVVGQYTDHGPTPLNPHHVTRKQLQVLGSWAFAAEHYVDYVLSLPMVAARFDLARLITPYDLDSANEALADMRCGKTIKPVLRGSR